MDQRTNDERIDRSARENVRVDVVRQPSIERETAIGDQLFPEQDRSRHQKRWESIQTSFVDDPRRAVQEADSLVTELTESIQDSFSRQRRRLEAAWSQGGNASTEDLRQALQQYRAYFTRLLSM